ncbi:MAG: hypothetical protein R3C49_14350 [Planctomycetaceae bacterium]
MMMPRPNRTAAAVAATLNICEQIKRRTASGVAMSLAVLTALMSSPLAAQQPKFPYQAQVIVDDVYARSGAGEAFYPTGILKRDAHVNVRRHDPGGWVMIDPPEGSFSWIPSKYVRRDGDQGEILQSNVVVFVGSSFGDETHVWQRKMMAGEKVRILSEEDVDTLSGPQRMFRIVPPEREYRWLPGSAVLPVGKAARAQHDKNPYQVPSAIAAQHAQQGVQQLQPPTGMKQSASAAAAAADGPASRYSPSVQLARLKQIREEQRELQELDQEFRSMILADPSQWKLEELQQKYLQLQDRVTHKPLAGQIDLRYPAIRRYQQRKAELEDFRQLTSATERRDAELLAGQFGLPMNSGQVTFVDENGQTIVADTGGSAETTVAGGMMFGLPLGASMSSPIPGFQEGTVPLPSTESFSGINSIAGNMPGSGVLLNPSGSDSVIGAMSPLPSNQYVGAGYLQRSANSGGNDYVLTNPAGKILAHVFASGSVDLEQHVGQSVGLLGSRTFDSQLKTDRIDVSGLEAVRVRQ